MPVISLEDDVTFIEVASPNETTCITLKAKDSSSCTIELILDHEAITAKPIMRGRSDDDILSLSGLPVGFHSLRHYCGETDRAKEHHVIVHPQCCYLPDASKTEDALTIQLYAARSGQNWGIGDFTDLARILQRAEGLFSYVAVNPLNCLDAAHAEEASPYSPDSRLLFNELYIDVPAAARLLNSPAVEHFLSPRRQQLIDGLRKTPWIKYGAVRRLKVKALVQLYQSAKHAAGGFGADYEAFCLNISDMARTAAMHRAQKRRLTTLNEDDRLPFELFLQWICQKQFNSALASSSCRLLSDLPVGCNINSADVSAFPSMFILDKTMGAPPDEFCRDGQNWNVAPLDISALRKSAYAYFRETLSLCMTEGGALRVDHILGYMSRFVMTKGEPPSKGAHEPMPFEEFVAILAIESQRKRCIVIGEDLGVLPPRLRPKMLEHKILGSVVFLLEADGVLQNAIAPERLACGYCSFATHDFPPFDGYFKGVDIDLNLQFGRLDTDDALAQIAQRHALATKIV